MGVLKHKKFTLNNFGDLELGAKLGLFQVASGGDAPAATPAPIIEGDKEAVQKLSDIQVEKAEAGERAPTRMVVMDMDAGTQSHAKMSVGDHIKSAAHATTDAAHKIGDRIAEREFTVKDENGRTVRGEDGKPLKSEERSEFNVGPKGRFRDDADYHVTEEQQANHEYPWSNVEGREILNERISQDRQGEREAKKFNKRNDGPELDPEEVQQYKMIERGGVPIGGLFEERVKDEKREDIARKIDGREFTNFAYRADHTDITEPGSKYEATGKLFRESKVSEVVESQQYINNMVNFDRPRSPEFDAMLKKMERENPERYQAYRDAARKEPEQIRKEAEETVQKSQDRVDFETARGAKPKRMEPRLPESVERTHEDMQASLRSVDLSAFKGMSSQESSVHQATTAAPGAPVTAPAPSAPAAGQAK